MENRHRDAAFDDDSAATASAAGEMRRISVKYRCSMCGLEIKLTLAPDEDPPPPRHCLEDMDLVAPIE